MTAMGQADDWGSVKATRREPTTRRRSHDRFLVPRARIMPGLIDRYVTGLRRLPCKSTSVFGIKFRSPRGRNAISRRPLLHGCSKTSRSSGVSRPTRGISPYVCTFGLGYSRDLGRLQEYSAGCMKLLACGIAGCSCIDRPRMGSGRGPNPQLRARCRAEKEGPFFQKGRASFPRNPRSVSQVPPNAGVDTPHFQLHTDLPLIGLPCPGGQRKRPAG